jgi:uncharacterized circularly permuted ATP-grasp superfamily protein
MHLTRDGVKFFSASVDTMSEMLSRRTQILSLGFLLLLLIGAGPSQPYYDEVFDENGALRLGYSEVYPVYQKLTNEDKKRIQKVSKKKFSGDNALDPLPRILTQAEFNELKRGVEQRGRALRLFLVDYYAGKDEVVHRLIPKTVLDRIVSRSVETRYHALVVPESIAFPYGPDLIRDAKGAWRVVEDNPGYIGGVGDLIQARKSLLNLMPAYADRLTPLDSPERFYNDLVSRYKSLSNPADGALVIYSVPPYDDHEDFRLNKIMKELGVEVVTPFTQKRLTVKDSGLYLYHKKNRKIKQRVGYVILNGEHHFIDFTHPAAHERALVEEAKGHLEERFLSPDVRNRIQEAIQPNPSTGMRDISQLSQAIQGTGYLDDLALERVDQVKGLPAAVLSGQVPTNYTPGVDFIGDKEFYVYVEDLVRFYLHEEPILKNIPTSRFAAISAEGRPMLNQDLVDRVFQEQERYVIKAVDGRGGDAVWVGPSISKEEFQAVKQKILAEPERFIAQEFTHLSVMDKKIVDLRMISAVDRKGVFVSPTPWGRALPLGGDGKVNLSSHGMESAVVVVENPKPFCIKDSLSELLE